MADTDTASYITRYNLVSLNPEYFNGSDWYPMNIVPGDLTLASGNVFVGSASGIATGVTLTGDASISNTGVMTVPQAVHILASDPGTPTEGQVWYNSTSHLLKFYNGTAVKTVATV